jgi:hypothetical protein
MHNKRLGSTKGKKGRLHQAPNPFGRRKDSTPGAEIVQYEDEACQEPRPLP